MGVIDISKIRPEEQALLDALKKNPDAEVLISVDNDFTICDDFTNTCTTDYGVRIEHLRVCEDNGYHDIEEYRDYLNEDTDLTNEQIDERIKEARQNNEFQKYIVISVG